MTPPFRERASLSLAPSRLSPRGASFSLVHAFFLSETVSGIPTRLVCLTSSNNNSGSVRNINREDHGLQLARERRGSFRPPDGSASLTAFQSSVIMHIHRGPDLMSRKLWRVSLGRHFLRNQLLPFPGELSILSSLDPSCFWHSTFILFSTFRYSDRTSFKGERKYHSLQHAKDALLRAHLGPVFRP